MTFRSSYPLAPGGAGNPHRQDGDARQLSAGARHAAVARPHHRSSLDRTPRGRDRAPPASHRPRPRTDPAGARYPPRPDRLFAGARQRHRGRRDEIEAPSPRRSTPSITAACLPTPPTLPAPSSCTPSPSTTLSRAFRPSSLRYSVLCPATDLSFIEEARRKFIAESAYLDDRPGAPDALSRRSEPPPDHPARGAARGCGGSEGRAERPHPDRSSTARPSIAVLIPRRDRSMSPTKSATGGRSSSFCPTTR